MATKKTEQSVSFEEGLQQLEALAAEMENSSLPLEELLVRYENGVKLAETLNAKLEDMKGRLVKLSAKPEEKEAEE